jgi:hypothetical protein
MTTETRTIDISEISEDEIKAAIEGMQPIPPKPGDYQETALLHVRARHPSCTRVLFDNMGRWRYMGAGNEAFAFGDSINVDLLEVASDVLNELPVLFELPLAREEDTAHV